MASLLAALMLIVVFGPVTAFAGSYVIMEENGWQFRYYLNGVIELTAYTGSARNVTVPDKIGVHPVSGFYVYPEEIINHIVSGWNVESITFKLRVGEIPKHFADHCPNLKSVTLPDTVETIGMNAFKGCASLTDITLPGGIKTIGESAFSNCEALTQINLPESIKTIGDYAFLHCTSLTSVTLPSGLQGIPAETFYGCTCLTKADIPASVRLIRAGDETHVEYTTAEMTACAHEASCVSDAYTVYEALWGDNSDTRAVTQADSALGHDYGSPEWKWTVRNVGTEEAEELAVNAVMEMVCLRCGETFTWDADVTSEVTAQPTAAEPGETAYTGTVTANGQTYTCDLIREIPATGQSADEAAQALIDAIGEVTYTPDCKAAIDMARALYESLTEEEKALVTNLAVLEAAEQAYAALTPDIPGGPDAPDDSDDTDSPDDPQGDSLCKWCEKPHKGFWGKLTGFFHSILYFFAHLFGRR